MLQGTVVKAAGGFFTVRDEDGQEHTCRARGILKRGRETLMVGDRVQFKPGNKISSSTRDDGLIEKIEPRDNCLQRPPVSNVDQLAVIMSLKHPSCDWQLVSRMLVLAEKENMSAFVCLNKIDLTAEEEILKIENQIKPYPYRVLYTSAVTGTGIAGLKEQLKEKCSVFAGPSGVGKSTLLNAIQPGLSLKTGTVSDKIKRGRHTTRQAELLSLDLGGMVVDTPGFTRLDFSNMSSEELAFYFPELEELAGSCGFRDCKHLTEPRCAVREEVGSSLNPMRYEHYKYFVSELDQQEAY